MIEAAANALSFARGRRLRRTVLNKILFYADLEALLLYGSQISSSAYVAIENGPVVAKYPKKLIGPMLKSGMAVEDGLGIKLIAAPPPLSAEHSDIIRQTVTKYGSLSANEVSNLSHDNPGWLAAWRGVGLAAGVIDMSLAMQELIDADDWLDSELTDDERNAVAEAIDGGCSEWR